ncbi:MAG: PHB depolymerase family esterase [Betaproteobacteria bacterium]
MHRHRAFDAQAINVTIERALSSAGLDTGTGPMKQVTETIRRALRGGRDDTLPTQRAFDRIDAGAEVVRAETVIPDPGTRRPDTGGEFTSHSFSNDAGTRTYKLYVPGSYGRSLDAVAMVVMLHGCTQSPDDFAAGTRMNELAEQHGFLVVYPAQPVGANGSKCWNWFQPVHQRRDTGEASLIAGITREVAAHHRIDRSRVFVAGLSAGAAMAIVVATAYPDVFAAAGAHSGLAYGSARDVASALAAMGSGDAPPLSSATLATAAGAARRLPIITFHGDRDNTVNVRNSSRIVLQALAGRALRRDDTDGALGGRAYRCTRYVDATGLTVIEQWTLRGAGHAWSGGSAAGSFTDPGGPDASGEMVRFFLSQSHGEST